MTDTIESIHQRIDSAVELQAVVRTMKALSAAHIGQYENAVFAVQQYYKTVELGLVALLRGIHNHTEFHDNINSGSKKVTGVIVFGSDQGLVGQFNDQLVEHINKTLSSPNDHLRFWVVGERMRDLCDVNDMSMANTYTLPTSVNAISGLVETILLATESACMQGAISQLYVFHNRSSGLSNRFEPVSQRMLPLDVAWQQSIKQQPWKTPQLPETVGDKTPILQILIREYLFVSLFQACAESLASEHASRLSTMQRAEKNIGEMLVELTHDFHQLRQQTVDAELFDVLAGFHA